MDALRGEASIAERSRRAGNSQGIHYKWSKDFMEAGTRRLAGGQGDAHTHIIRHICLITRCFPAMRDPPNNAGQVMACPFCRTQKICNGPVFCLRQ